MELKEKIRVIYDHISLYMNEILRIKLEWKEKKVEIGAP